MKQKNLVLSKRSIGDEIAKQFGFSHAMGRSVVDAVFASMTQSLLQNQSIRVVGFGHFVLRNRVARRGRNPQTGQSMALPVTTTVGFIPSVALRRSLNHPTPPSST